MQAKTHGVETDLEEPTEPETPEAARAAAIAALERDGIPAAAIGIIMELVARLAAEDQP